MTDILIRKTFIRAAKKINKRYALLWRDIDALVETLVQNPTQGVDLGNGFYKIRMTITGKISGKSGGARVITYLYEPETDTENTVLHLVYLYDKTDTNSISKNDMLDMLNYD
jgi:hypothetical protein